MMTEGQKFDKDKSRVELLDADFLDGVGRVLGFGAQKYAAHNWRGGISISRLLGSSLRHTFELLKGNDYDVESGLHHALHLGCNAMFLYWTMVNKPSFDDRWKDGSLKSNT